MIVFAEFQKLRKITWILLIGCITYIFLIVVPERPLPSSYESNELNKIDSSEITDTTNYPIENNTVDEQIIHEAAESIDKIIDSNEVDSTDITEAVNYLIENKTTDYSIVNETESIDKINSDESDIVDEIQNIKILALTIATDIVEKTPIGVSGLFLNDIDALFCFSAVDNTLNNNKIIHTWEHNGQVYFKSFIRIEESSYWRCWSRITIRPEMVGDWQVIVTDTVGNYLDSIEFSIVPINE